MRETIKSQHISGLKGIACLAVMVGHFAGIIKYTTSAEIDLAEFSFLSSPPFGVLFNESFWLYLFFLASGFLLALGKIESLSMLIQKIFRRFLRLGIPVLFASAGIYLIWIFMGMHNAATDSLFVNRWYQNAYNCSASVVDVLLSPIHVLILEKNIFNSPYWVLRDMFAASVLIYLCLYVQSKVSKWCWANYIVAYGGALLSCLFSEIVAACVIGFVLAQHRHHVKWFMKKVKWLGGVAIIIFIGCATLYPNPLSAVLLFGAIILLTPSFPKLDSLLSNLFLVRLEKISFGIYSFHWPVVCSVGGYILLTVWNHGAIWAFLLCGIASSFITILFSCFFGITAERATSYIIKNAMNAFSLVITNRLHTKK